MQTELQMQQRWVGGDLSREGGVGGGGVMWGCAASDEGGEVDVL